MPRYRRYVYIVTCGGKRPFIEWGSPNLCVEFHPAKADKYVDGVLANLPPSKVVVDETFTSDVPLHGELLRRVLIEYPDESRTVLCVERWPIWVGKE